MTYLLALDQGTTSSRAILFNEFGVPQRLAQYEFEQFFPDDGWVEHDAREIWSTTRRAATEVMSGIKAEEVAGIGITNQRETTILWDRHTGEPVYRAIVWQDRRTAARCEDLRAAGVEDDVRDRTGLLLDPYFSATKLAWILDEVPEARARAERGELAFGTVDSYLIWQLSGGQRHVTDATNASRTLLFNIHRQQWDRELLKLFAIPEAVLPEVLDSAADFATATAPFDGIAVASAIGDQQAALVGQGCLEPGMVKSTYGTGCFLVMNTGTDPLSSSSRLLTTIAYRLDGITHYALEGSIFIAGAAVQWLRDGLKLIERADQTEELAGDSAGVYLVPAFTGLGAPYWDPNARGALLGLTRGSGIAEICTATLQSVAYQTRDLVEAMARDGRAPSALKIDGGMVANDWMVQFLADMLAVPVSRPRVTETTALGAAMLAGLQQGVINSVADIAALWQPEREFQPSMDAGRRQQLYAGWQDAVRRVLSDT